ncbi:dedicated sortase system histidine kinase [Microbulbifer donghaiensis]|uniref:histidine kinase n=1 Tax=Microbulbifer donghaiensis TaxID=494016 RepID=A0A1M5HUT3_9GAMM|nr:ATP-binding protein [Microbulbifer donghaiensis]SHG19719.1 dedicated sortase system histidine kinase [Microbulbifer donghaiensis]
MKLRRQLLLVSLVALALPWAGCQYLRQVDQALAEGQLQALDATASAVAARLASAPQLIAPDPERHGRPPGAQLYLNPLPQAPLLDGYGDDWRPLELPARELLDQRGEALAQVTLGQVAGRVYLLLTVADSTPAYQDPRTGLLAGGDAIELHTADRHYTLPVASQGAAQAHWYNLHRGTHERELRLRGRWTSSARGYQLELSLPYPLTGGSLAVTVADRASSDGAKPLRSASTLPADGLPGKLVQPLPQLQAELDHFARPQLRLAVVDSEGFVLASSGQVERAEEDLQRPSWLRNWIYRRLLARESLPEMPAAQLPATLTQNRTSAEQWFRGPLEGRIGAVSVPVITRADDIIERPLLGRVVALQSAEALQSLTESAAHQLWLISCAAAGAALLLLLGYASWLSWRIRRLHRAARNAVDASGKLRGNFPRSRFGDELGALNRAFAGLLAELDQYHHYLRTLASKLSHELRTPLAVVRSSLDNLSVSDLDTDSRRYAERALDGSARLSGILNSLSAASNLEASIQQAETEMFDLADLLDVLVQSYGDAQRGHRFALDKPAGELPCRGAPELLAQLLDKLVDNACSFAPQDSEIKLSVAREKDAYRIEVENDGPLLPEGYSHKLFDSLVSVRDDGGRAGHLGLGLHIARLIADFHRGHLTAANRQDGAGVIFTLQLPYRAAVGPL